MALKKKISKELKKKIAGVKAIFCEVDGVLTNGKISYDASGKEYKQFHFRDSAIVPYLKKTGIIIGVISSRESDVVTRWCADLRLEFCHQNILDKLQTVQKLAAHYRLKLKDVAYIGSDVSDLPVFKVSGLGIVAGDAPDYIRAAGDLATVAKGGAGVLREVADLILRARGEFGSITL